MNITLFQSVLKKEALECYENLLNSFINHLFINEASDIKKDLLEFEINQKLGKKAYSSIMTSNLTAAQINFCKILVDNYKKRIEYKFLEKVSI